MEPAAAAIVKALILPPGVNFLLLLLGLAAAALRWRKSGWLLTLVALLSLYLFSITPVSRMLLAGVESYPALPPVIAHGDEQAIVVPGAGRYAGAPEYGGDTASTMALERLRYAAYLHRQTGLPILVSGGTVFSGVKPEAELLNDALRDVFNLEASWLEDRGRNTWENARYSRAMLEPPGIERIILVTHAFHMPRAVYAFETAGFQVTPAPTAFSTRESAGSSWLDWIPSASALAGTHVALHEWLGLLYYRWRFGGQMRV
jgi:uncharacterized SAM-binding protein YcdF (DUF218 family)